MTEPHTGDADPVVAVRIDVDGTVTLLTDDSYQTLHDAVGGLIEACPSSGCCIVWVNEEGKVLGLPRNPYGETMWFLVGDQGCLARGDWMAGPCVITGPADHEGDLTPLPAWITSGAITMTKVAKGGRVRLPFGPLEDLLNRRYYNLSSSADRQGGGRLTGCRLAELVGFSRQAVYRWQAEGVPLWSADRAAITAGFHPLEVWPNFGRYDVHGQSDTTAQQPVNVACARAS